jgi:hypothetical protein
MMPARLGEGVIAMLPRSSWLTITPAPGRSCARSRGGGRGRNLALAKFGAAVGQVLAAEDASARIRSASGQAQSTGRTARPSARSIRSDSRAASGRLLEAARSSKRDPDGIEAGGLERSLSVTGNFGAGSGSGALMKGAGSQQTPLWREMDSNFWFLVARPSNRHGRRDYCPEKRKPICWGTEGSNPAPSSRESVSRPNPLW